MSRRLLMAGGGTGSFVSAPLHPPSGAVWTKYVSNPVITADEAWDGNWVLEPCVLYESGTFKMIYTGDNNTTNSQQLGYATSTDGVTWTKHGSPVFGGGVGGEANAVTQPNVFKVGSTYYLYYRSNVDFLCVATSTDLLTWSVLATNIITNPDGQTEWNNSTIIDDGGTYHLIIEGEKAGIWRIYGWTGTDLVNWTPTNGGAELSTLRVAVGGMYGGPHLWPVTIGGLWHLWYHASTAVGNLPTNIYHATSADLVTWTQTGAVLTHAGSGFEFDQVADPSIVVVGTTAYMFYDGDNNVSFTGAIGLATATAV